MIPLNLFVSTKSLDAISFQSLFLGCPLRILPHQNLTPRNYLLPGTSSSLLLFTPSLSTLLYNPPISTDLLILFSPPNPSPFNPSQISPPSPSNSCSSKKPNLSPRLLLQSLFSIILSNFLKGYQSLEIIPTRFSATQSLCTNVPLVLSFLLTPPSLSSPRPSAQIHKSPGLNSSIKIISVFHQPSFLQIRGALVEIVYWKGSVEK